MIRKLLLVLALLLPSAAQAEWREVSSPNFIVYGESNEAALRAFTEKLERYNHVLRTVHNVTTPPDPNRLRVFLLPGYEAMARLTRPGVGGFYVPDSRGFMLVGVHGRGSDTISAEHVLLHEFAHHFMYKNFPATYPTWYSEGFADFWGTTRILANNVVEIGHPMEGRFQSFQFNRWVPLRRLLTAQSYADIPDTDLIYAQGWLLMRYVFENPARRRQLDAYLNAIQRGVSYEQAMNDAFGPDARQLNDELFSYAGRGRFNILSLPYRDLPTGAINVRVPGAAEQALMMFELRLSMGVANREIADFARDLAAAAAPFPDDPVALRLRAESQRLAGNAAGARSAVDRLLAVAPDDPRGLMLSARLQLDALRANRPADAAAWEAPRQLIRRAIRRAPNDPLLLEAYHDSFTAAGVLPPDDAQGALYTAMERAPSDDDLRYKVALDFEQRGMIEEAIAIIRPAALRAPSREDESESERRRRERMQERARDAGQERRETAREMLTRLEQRRGAQASN